MLDFLMEKASDIALLIAIVLCNIFNRPKSAEKIEQARQRKKEKYVAKLEKKSAKATAKADKAVNKLLAETQTENIKKE